MATKLRVDDRLPFFKSRLYSHMDDAVKEAARDTIIKAKTNAPFKGGDLRASSDIKKRSFMSYRVRFWMEYARFQEFGGDSTRTVRDYTTPGTGKHYLRDAGDAQMDKMDRKLGKHARRTI